MKKIMILAAAAAMFMFSSCQKEEVTPGQNSQSEELVFTATIDQNSTKTTINTTDGKIKWVAGDEITITDGNTSVAYVAESSGASVSFKKKDGETKSLASGSTYSATYKAAPSTSQAYDDYYSAANTAKDLYMTAPETSETTLTFTAACGLLKLNLKASSDVTDKTISEIMVFGKVNSSDVIYTLTCSSAQDISTAKDFYIALPAGDYSVFKFTNNTGHICYKTAQSAMPIANNEIQPVTLEEIVFNDMLPGKFSVASGKTVRFSKGNLWWDGSSFKLESNQTDYPKGSGLLSTWNPYHVGHFFWTTAAEDSYKLTVNLTDPSTSDVPFFAESNKSNWCVDGHSNLYALAHDEWQYLFITRGQGDTKFKINVTVNGTETCLVIAPDGYTGSIMSTYTKEEWATAEAAGLVCLPAAGYRCNDGQLIGTGHGWYWSATPYNDNRYSAYHQQFDSTGGVGDTAVYSSGRSDGQSVRLVCTAQ